MCDCYNKTINVCLTKKNVPETICHYTVERNGSGVELLGACYMSLHCRAQWLRGRASRGMLYVTTL